MFAGCRHAECRQHDGLTVRGQSMKRIHSLKFALLGATALTLVACGESNEDVLAYDSVEACIKAGQHDAATCKAEFEKAQRLHAETAPRYNRASDCYSDFGYNRCYRPSGTSIWLPFMMGYMLAPRGGPSYIYSQPLYRSSSDPNVFRTSTNAEVGRVGANGRSTVAQSKAKRPPARTRTVSRGGFGKRASSGFRSGS